MDEISKYNMSDLQIVELWSKIKNAVDTVASSELEPNTKRINKNG